MVPRTLARAIAQAASDTKAIDIVVLDLQKLTSFTDYFIICSGASDRQLSAIANAIRQSVKAKGRLPIGFEGERSSHWMVVDYGDVVAHIFHQDERDYYQIERLWADAPRITFIGVTSEAKQRQHSEHGVQKS